MYAFAFKSPLEPLSKITQQKCSRFGREGEHSRSSPSDCDDSVGKCLLPASPGMKNFFSQAFGE